jgi:dTDP-4-amino-4,6-dideoxygalactose transaminase
MAVFIFKSYASSPVALVEIQPFPEGEAMYIPVLPGLSPAYFLKRTVTERMPFPLDRSNSVYFYVARNGIYHLMRSLAIENGGSVLAPDYYHGNEIRAIRAAGAAIQHYPIKKNLQLDLDVLYRLCKSGPRILYVTHFIGWPQPMKEIQQICQEFEITLIEDCALSFMSAVDDRPLGSFGDYSVFCLYKTVPVPNGGVLVQNRRSGVRLDSDDLRQCSSVSLAGRTSELMLEWFRSRYEWSGRCLFAVKRAAGKTLTAGNLRRIPVGDSGFNVDSTGVAMSQFCHSLLPRFSFDRIKESRRSNFLALENRLRDRVRLLEVTLTDGVCPLFFPLLVSNKSEATRRLSDRGVQTIEFWNPPASDSFQPGSEAEFLRGHLLEVPIHQDLDSDAVEYIADQIIDLGIGLRP